MSKKERTALLEIAITGMIVMVAMAMFWNSLSLPESLREPLGSAKIPQAVCIIIIVFCAILIVRSVKIIAGERSNRAAETEDVSETNEAKEIPAFRRRGDQAVKVFLIAVVYVALIQTQWITSKFLTPVFLGTAILTLNEFRRNAFVPAILIALVIGLGTNFLFTDFFYVDLP